MPQSHTWLSWLSGRTLAAQARGVLGSTPGRSFHFPLFLPHNIFLYFQREARCSEHKGTYFDHGVYKHPYINRDPKRKRDLLETLGLKYISQQQYSGATLCYHNFISTSQLKVPIVSATFISTSQL